MAVEMINFQKLQYPYLIGEAGINHNGDLGIAKKLIDATFATSWNCVKFQKRTPPVCVPEHQKNLIMDTPWGKMTYLEYKYKIEFGREEYNYIDKYCREKPLVWTASVWDLDSLEFLELYELPFIKIPSAMLTNHELLIETAKTGLPVLLSTGMSTLEEVDQAVDLLEQWAKSYAILHCNSAYPASYDELNLGVIPRLIERYNCVVGYSGHEYGLEPTIIAVVLGARIVERHISVDHDLWGTDQKCSVEVHGMNMLYKRILAFKEVIGDGIKVVTENELSIRKKLRGK